MKLSKFKKDQPSVAALKRISSNLSPIAKTARLETATETQAEYIGYLNSEIDTEQDKAEPNTGRIEALEHQLDIVVDERHSMTPDNLALINRALYVYAPLLKAMHG